MSLWTPANISTALWLDASDAATVTSDADGLSQISDKSGNARHATQSVIANRPDVTADAIDFTDAAHYLTITTPLQTTQSIFIVLETTDTSYVLFGSGADTNYGLCGESGSGFAINGNFGSPTYKLDSSTASWTTRGQVYAALNNRLSIVQIVGANFPAWAALKLSGYNIPTYPQYSFLGGIKEIVVFDGTPSSEITDYIEGYLAWKHGVEANLRAGHPYLSAAPTVTVEIGCALGLGGTLEGTVPGIVCEIGLSSEVDAVINDITLGCEFALGGTVDAFSYSCTIEGGLGLGCDLDALLWINDIQGEFGLSCAMSADGESIAEIQTAFGLSCSLDGVINTSAELACAFGLGCQLSTLGLDCILNGGFGLGCSINVQTQGNASIECAFGLHCSMNTLSQSCGMLTAYSAQQWA